MDYIVNARAIKDADGEIAEPAQHLRCIVRQATRGDGVWTVEEAALSQDLCIHVQKRTAATTGALTDAITHITMDNAVDELTNGTIRRCVVP